MTSSSRGRRRGPGARSALAALGCGALLVLAPAAGASAHDRLRATDPPDGATVAAAPAQVVLTFDQPAIALGSRVVVLGPDGSTVSAGDPRLVDDEVTQDLAGDLPAGGYRVEWRVTSGDGHPVEGGFAFTAAGAGTGAAGAASASPSASSPAPSSAPSLDGADAPTAPAAGAAPAGGGGGLPAGAVAVGAAAVVGAALAVAVGAVLRRRRGR